MKIAVVTIAYSSSACASSVLETLPANHHTDRVSSLPAFQISRPYGGVQAYRSKSRSHLLLLRIQPRREQKLERRHARSLRCTCRCSDHRQRRRRVRFRRPRQTRRKAVACRDRYIVSCAGFHQRLNQRQPSVGYSCFAINPIAIEKLGCFDENIFPRLLRRPGLRAQGGSRGAARRELSRHKCLTHAGSNTVLSDSSLGRQNAAHSQTQSRILPPEMGWRWRIMKSTTTRSTIHGSITILLRAAGRAPYGPIL